MFFLQIRLSKLPFRCFFFLSILLFSSALGAAEDSDIFIRAVPEAVHSLNPFSLTGWSNYEIEMHLIDFLASKKENNDEFQPALAETWEISKDKKTFTFHLQKNVKWHDGTPFTASDVKFSLDSLRDPKYQGANWAPIYEDIEKAEVVDEHTIRFTAKSVQFSNFGSVAAALRIFPKHFYEQNNGDKWSEAFIGTGPYRVKEFIKEKRVVLEQNPDWWGRKDPKLRDKYIVPKIMFKFVSEPLTAFAMIQNGELDQYPLTTARDLETLHSFPGWKKSLFSAALKIPDHSLSWEIILNLKNPLFQSRNTRLALNHLWNRENLNKKLFGGSLKLETSPWPASGRFCLPTPPLRYDLAKALKLLRADGWGDSDGDGILDKEINGKRKNFAFTIVYDQKDLDPFLTLYIEDAKKAGIQVALQFIDPSLTWKTVNEKRYDAFADHGPSYAHISYKTFHSGAFYNENAYSNAKVDTLLEDLDVEFNLKKRLKIQRALFRLITDDVTEILGFEDDKEYHAISKRVLLPKNAPAEKSSVRYWTLKTAR